MVPAVISRNVISPLSLLVLPAPSRSSMSTLPSPVLIVVPGAMVITALPGERKASTTPFSAVSLAASVRLPLLVEMLALTRMLRPACSERSPLLVLWFPARMAELTVMSLLALSTRLLPPLSREVISSGVKVLSVPGLEEYACVRERGVTMSTRPVLFSHAGELTTKHPFMLPALRGVIPPEPT